jgi:hypothetical protein
MPHAGKQRECLTFRRVADSNNGDRSRIVLEVGSVLPFRSTRSTKLSFGRFCAEPCVMVCFSV